MLLILYKSTIVLLMTTCVWLYYESEKTKNKLETYVLMSDTLYDITVELGEETQTLRDSIGLINSDCGYDQRVDKVKVTMYHPVPEQTDDTPNITADGTIIAIDNASQYRYIAVSRDLLKKNGGEYEYGDRVLLIGTGDKDGIYEVRDTMNSRWTNRIDILESPNVPPYKFDEALLVKMDYVFLEN